jgi:hypothetical protein
LSLIENEKEKENEKEEELTADWRSASQYFRSKDNAFSRKRGTP